MLPRPRSARSTRTGSTPHTAEAHRPPPSTDPPAQRTARTCRTTCTFCPKAADPARSMSPAGLTGGCDRARSTPLSRICSERCCEPRFQPAATRPPPRRPPNVSPRPPCRRARRARPPLPALVPNGIEDSTSLPRWRHLVPTTAADNYKRDQSVRACVVAVGDERRTVKAFASAKPDQGGQLVADESDRSCRRRRGRRGGRAAAGGSAARPSARA